LAVKKETEAEKVEATIQESKEDVEKSETTNRKAKQSGETKIAEKSNEGFCVYLGPTIRGVVQAGAIFKGEKSEAIKAEPLKSAIKKYPRIKLLIVQDKDLAQDRIKVKTQGNALYANYQKLISGK
jgi:ribosomal protein S1